MQGRFTVPLPTATPRTCVVCEQPLDRHPALTPRKGVSESGAEAYPLCREPACRGLFERAGGATDTDFRRRLQLLAQTTRMGRAQMEIRAGLLREHAEVEARQNAAAFAAMGRRGKQQSPQALQLVVPSGHAPSRPLSRRRRQAYAAHLDTIIAAALEDAEPPVQTTATPVAIVQPAPDQEAGAAAHSLPARLCGVCGGGCCAFGSNHAYLSKPTIQRVLAANPGLDPAGLRDTYLGHLTPRTVSYSCIHHTRHGCSLPGSLRSDICNSYVCDALLDLQRRLKAEPPVREVAVLRRRQNRWRQANPTLNNDIVSAAVLTETATTMLKPPNLAAQGAGEASEVSSR